MRLMIVIASTRPGRAGLPIGNWFTARAAEHEAFDVDLADLAEIGLPFMDEPKHPRLREYTHQHTKDWSARVEAADAFVFVHPEYNHSYNAPLKNAIDFLHEEWRDKPVGFVSYGGVAAGTRAMQALKPVVAALHMVPAVEAVNIPFFFEFLEDGELKPNEVLQNAATAMLDRLALLAKTLAPLRPPRERPRDTAGTA